MNLRKRLTWSVLPLIVTGALAAQGTHSPAPGILAGLLWGESEAQATLALSAMADGVRTIETTLERALQSYARPEAEYAAWSLEALREALRTRPLDIGFNEGELLDGAGFDWEGFDLEKAKAEVLAPPPGSSRLEPVAVVTTAAMYFISHIKKAQREHPAAAVRGLAGEWIKGLAPSPEAILVPAGGEVDFDAMVARKLFSAGSPGIIRSAGRSLRRVAQVQEVFESDLKILERKPSELDFHLKLGGSPWRAWVSFTRKGKPWILLARDDIPEIRRFSLAQARAGAAALSGMGIREKDVTVQVMGGPGLNYQELVFMEEGREASRVRYGKLLEAAHEGALKLTPLGANYAIWLEEHPAALSEGRALYVLIRLSDSRNTLCVIPLEWLKPGRATGLYLNGFEITALLEFSGRIRVWIGPTAQNVISEVPYHDLEEQALGEAI